MKTNTVTAPSAAADQALAELVDQLTERLAAGEAVDLDGVVAEHPQHAARLRAIWPALQTLVEIGSSTGRGSGLGLASIPRSNTAGEHLGTLGDFRLIREIGRGGMGIVYEAEQLSLRRRVALKILPFASLLDPRQLTRFQNEAYAAASLHHEHIVPVYGTGQDRGIHYYAMQYIEGQTLADLIADLAGKANDVWRGSPDPAEPPTAGLPTPPRAGDLRSDPVRGQETRTQLASSSTVNQRRSNTAASKLGKEHYRRVAQIGIQVAQALEYAHQQGIVHRDVKPSNIMLDAQGKAWVLDFGLAAIESQSNLTMTGDLIGTLRYMSPEQSIGRNPLIDHRTDIYSLGATLYELLTLRPVNPGTDRATMLVQISDREPHSPRCIDSSIPADLETIVLKTLEKEPSDRYGSAALLAADMQRFLAHRSILARPPTLLRRVQSWSRRHSNLVLTGMACLAVVALVGIISVVVIWRALDDARFQAAEAELQRNSAEQLFRRSMDGVGQLLTVLERPEWAGNPLIREVSAVQSEQAMAFLRTFAHENRNDPEACLQTAIAHVTISGILSQAGDHSAAQASLRDAIPLFSQLVADDPQNATYRIELAQNYFILGLEYYDSGRGNEASPLFRLALEQFTAARSLTPDNPRALQILAWFHLMCPEQNFREPSVALACAKLAVAKLPQSGMHHNTLGIAHYRSGHFEAAHRSLSRSVELSNGGDSLDAFFLAMTCWRLGRFNEAHNWYQKGLEWRIDKNRTSDFELRLFKAEADELFAANLGTKS